jgi:hypothetical protein
LTIKAAQCYIQRQVRFNTGGFSTQEGQDMRKLACLLLLAGGAFTMGGCASPAYTGGENVARTLRNWDYENKQMIDDINYELMFQPASHSTIWNLQ